jgi:hypothetical protein
VTNVVVVWNGWNQSRTSTCYLTYHTVDRDFVGWITHLDEETPTKAISVTSYNQLKVKMDEYGMAIPSKAEIFATILRGEML